MKALTTANFSPFHRRHRLRQAGDRLEHAIIALHTFSNHVETLILEIRASRSVCVLTELRVHYNGSISQCEAAAVFFSRAHLTWPPPTDCFLRRGVHPRVLCSSVSRVLHWQTYEAELCPIDATLSRCLLCRGRSQHPWNALRRLRHKALEVVLSW